MKNMVFLTQKNGIRSLRKFSVELAIQTKITIIVIIVSFTPLIVDAPIEEDFDRSLTECLFYTIPDIPELHYFYEVYHPWPYDKPNWGSTK